MARQTKAQKLRGNMARSTITALQVLAGMNQPRGKFKDSQLSGHLAPASACRKLEGYGCVKVVDEYPVGRGHQLDVRVTALGHKVAEGE